MTIKKLAISLLVGGLFVINGCGGGGGSLADKPTASDMQKLDDSNADKSAMGSLKSLNSSSSLNNNGVPGASLRVKNRLTKLTRLSTNKALRDASNICDSGSAKTKNSSDTEGTLTYNQCSIDGTVYNGTISVKVTLDSYGQAKDLTATFDNFTSHNSTGDYNIQHAELYSSRDTNKASISKMYATFTENGATEKYLNFNISTNGNGSNSMLTFKGYVKPKCLDGFVYIESLPSITKDNGKFKIESNSKRVTIEYDTNTVKITKPSGAVETMTRDEFNSKLNAGC